jgi:transcriptional regulator with XRE-family HTH domain
MHHMNIHVKHRNSPSDFEGATDKCDTNQMTIEQIRQAKGLNQIELAEIAGLSQSAVSRAENGEEGTTLRTFLAIANALNVQLRDLFDDRSAAEVQLLEIFRRLPAERQVAWLEMSRIFAQDPGEPRR